MSFLSLFINLIFSLMNKNNLFKINASWFDYILFNEVFYIVIGV